jgi:hypothetical protein
MFQKYVSKRKKTTHLQTMSCRFIEQFKINGLRSSTMEVSQNALMVFVKKIIRAQLLFVWLLLHLLPQPLQATSQADQSLIVLAVGVVVVVA